MIWFLTFLPEEKNVMSTWMYSLDLERHKDSFWGRDLADKPTVQAANCHFGCLSSNLDVAKGLDDFWPTRKRHSKTALECLPVVKDPFLLGVPMPHNGASNACKSCDLCLTSSEVFKPLQAFWTLLLNFGLRSVFRKQSNNIKGATAFVHHLLDAQHVFPSLKDTFVWGDQFEKQTLRKCVFSSTKRWNETRKTRLLFSRLGGLAVSRVGLLWGALQKDQQNCHDSKPVVTVSVRYEKSGYTAQVSNVNANQVLTRI